MLSRLTQAARLALLAGLGLYNVATFHENVSKYAADRSAQSVAGVPAWLRRPWLTGLQAWPANWKMFTFKDPLQVFVDFEGWVPAAARGGPADGDAARGDTAPDGYWVRLPMERWYPARWESGYRWDKGGYENSAARRGWLRGACEHANEEAARGPGDADDAGPAVTKTRALVLHWTKSTGRGWQPQKQRKERVLGEVACKG